MYLDELPIDDPAPDEFGPRQLRPSTVADDRHDAQARKDRLTASATHPLREWAMYAALLLSVFIVLTGRLFVRAIREDNSGLCIVILLVFCAALLRHVVDMMYIQRQMKLAALQLEGLIVARTLNTFVRDGSSSLFRDHVRHLYEIARRDPEVSQDNLVALLQARLHARTRLTEVIAGLLVTLGLIGTIIGLISAVGGLGGVIEAVGADRGGLLHGIRVTLSGMGTAFYTTLVGSVLGSVVLPVLGTVVESHAESLIAHIAELCEIYIVPTLRRASEESRRRRLGTATGTGQ